MTAPIEYSATTNDPPLDAAAVCSFRSRSPEATHHAGSALASALGDGGLVIGLDGGLGAGKTAFVKGLAAGLGIDPTAVASPTFVIASEYETARGGILVHLDLYRVASVDELESAGFLDLLDPSSVVAVEWANRCAEALPVDRLDVGLVAGSAEMERIINARANGPRAAVVLARWRPALEEIERCP